MQYNDLRRLLLGQFTIHHAPHQMRRLVSCSPVPPLSVPHPPYHNCYVPCWHLAGIPGAPCPAICELLIVMSTAGCHTKFPRWCSLPKNVRHQSLGLIAVTSEYSSVT